MRFVPGLTNSIKDAAVRQLFEFVLKLLGNVVEYNIYKVTTVWRVPFKLNVPTSGNATRTVGPDVVRVGRAVAKRDEITPVYTGSVHWDWAGGGQVVVYDVEGLVEGVTYDLVFEVLSNG